MEETLQFLIMVDADYDRQGILGIILECFPDAVRLKSNSCDLRGNVIEVWENENFDQSLVQDEEEGFLYYKWRVEATPMKGDIREAEQIQLARDLRDCFEAAGSKVVVCANFEDKV